MDEGDRVRHRDGRLGTVSDKYVASDHGNFHLPPWPTRFSIHVSIWVDWDDGADDTTAYDPKDLTVLSAIDLLGELI